MTGESPSSEHDSAREAGGRYLALRDGAILLGCGLMILAFVLAVVQSLNDLRANLYLEQGLHHAAALAVSLEIERALRRSAAVLAALLIVGGLGWLLLRTARRMGWPKASDSVWSRRAGPTLRGLSRSTRLRALAGASAVVLGAGYAYALNAARPPVPDGPDILLIVMDTVRKSNLSLYGHFRNTTPQIERFAEEAVVFDNAFAIGAWTVPNHASMFTGLLPSQHGATQESKYLPATALTVAELLSEHGYDTAGFTNNVNVAAKKGFAQGFLHFRELFRSRVRRGYERGVEVPDGDSGAVVTRLAALEWLDDRSSSHRPFFLFLNYIEAHTPYRPPARFVAEYLEGDEALPDYVFEYDYVDYLAGAYEPSDSEFGASQALYDAEIHYLDEEIGKLLAELDERGALDDTLIIITSDHGEAFGEHELVGHQFGLYDTVLRVPLIVRTPGSNAGGVRSQRWVNLSDLFPTILEVAAVDLPSGELSRGKSLFDEGEPGRAVAEYYKPRQYLRKLAERHPDFDRSRFDRRIRSLRQGDYKLIWSSDGRHELYDVKQDPGEERDLAVERPEDLQTLAGQLDHWPKEEAGALAAPPPRTEPEIDKEMRAELEALGYVE